jgi:hypothetical protein
MRLIQGELGSQNSIVIHKHGDANAMWVVMSADETPAVIWDLPFHNPI